jgi:hypothetical protein
MWVTEELEKFGGTQRRAERNICHRVVNKQGSAVLSMEEGVSRTCKWQKLKQQKRQEVRAAHEDKHTGNELQSTKSTQDPLGVTTIGPRRDTEYLPSLLKTCWKISRNIVCLTIWNSATIYPPENLPSLLKTCWKISRNMSRNE